MSYTYYRRYQPSRGVQKKPSHFGSFFSLVVFLVLLGLALRACVSVVSQLYSAKENEAILSLTQGSAEVLVWGHQDFTPASDAQIVLMGDEIKTAADGFASLKFMNGTQVLLGPSTHVYLADLDPTHDPALTLKLKQGRVFMQQVPDDKGEIRLKLQTDLFDVLSSKADYLLEFNSGREAIYVLDGEATLNYMDRGGIEEVLVDARTLGSGESSVFDSAKKQTFLSRADVVMTEPAGKEISLDALVQWGQTGSLSFLPVDANPAEELPAVSEEIEEETVVEEEAVSLQIRIVSPQSPFALDGSAIAIEGALVGEAERVTVSWSGSGVAYPLGLFEPGSTQFRYVADANYGNIQPGENKYTIIAYAKDGTASRPITVVINASY
jgi:hypothetical protein